MTSLGLDSYVVTDSFFGVPYIDEDEQRSEPVEHRYIHGGFEGTSTRFALCYPPAARWQGRLFQPLEGANAGHENVNTGPLGQVTGGLEMIFRMGGYAVESNMGHIGDVMDPKAGPDPTIYGYRAAAESARFAKFVAAQIYGAPTAYAYVYGGSGGARGARRCAWPTRPTCGTRPCPTWATPRTATTATCDYCATARPISAPCSTSSASSETRSTT